MKVFGIEIGNKKIKPKVYIEDKLFGDEKEPASFETIEDQIPEIKATIPDIIKPALMPRIKDPTIKYHSSRSFGRGSFIPSEYALAEIGRVEDVESFARQAFDKKVALMFKEGWDLVGPNIRTVKYIKTRFAQISQATALPTQQLFRDIGSALIRKSNCFVVKVRKTEASGGKVRTLPGTNSTLKPVAGYFIAPAETMEYKLSEAGLSSKTRSPANSDGSVSSTAKLVKWRQKMPDGNFKEYNPRDIVHFYFDKKEGFTFGTPTLIPVIDDIRALRKIEENIELLIYQHLFPLFQYKVGTDNAPAGVTESGDREIDVVKREIQFMPSEGGIVTSERHEITAIGSEGRAIRAEGYLDHFKKRVISGLGISAVDLGEGETANRATADNMSRNLIDSVKDFQQIMEVFINEFLINELLLESTFGTSVLDDENLVKLRFKEIDVDAQIKKEAHVADQFAKDMVHLDEARVRIGLDPIEIPTRKEIESEQDTAVRFPQWHRMRWKLFEEPKLLIQALDEPYSPFAKALASNRSTDITEGDIEEAGQNQEDREVNLEKERARAKANTAPPRRTKDGFLAETFLQIKEDVVARVAREERIDHDWVSLLVRTQMQTTINRLVAEQVLAFRNGYSRAGGSPTLFLQSITSARSTFQKRAERYITKLTNNIVSALKRKVKDENLAITTRAVFEALQFRTNFIEDVEIRKADRLGEAFGIKSLNQPILYSIVTDGSACPTCIERNNEPIDLETTVVIDDLPPHHAGCNCFLSTVPNGDSSIRVINSIQDEQIDEPTQDLIESGEVTSCPSCGKTAIRTKDTPDIYHCRACGDSFRVLQEENEEEIEEQTNASRFSRCRKKAAARIRTDNPGWTAERVSNAAEEACLHVIDEEEEENITDQAKLESCVLKVKAQLRKKNPGMNEDKIKSSAFAICNSRIKGK